MGNRAPWRSSSLMIPINATIYIMCFDFSKPIYQIFLGMQNTHHNTIDISHLNNPVYLLLEPYWFRLNPRADNMVLKANLKATSSVPGSFNRICNVLIKMAIISLRCCQIAYYYTTPKIPIMVWLYTVGFWPWYVQLGHTLRHKRP